MQDFKKMNKKVLELAVKYGVVFTDEFSLNTKSDWEVISIQPGDSITKKIEEIFSYPYVIGDSPQSLSEALSRSYVKNRKKLKNIIILINGYDISYYPDVEHTSFDLEALEAFYWSTYWWKKSRGGAYYYHTKAELAVVIVVKHDVFINYAQQLQNYKKSNEFEYKSNFFDKFEDYIVPVYFYSNTNEFEHPYQRLANT